MDPFDALLKDRSDSTDTPGQANLSTLNINDDDDDHNADIHEGDDHGHDDAEDEHPPGN